MNRELAFAFSSLRVAEKETVLRELGYSTHQAVHETGQQFVKRVLQLIASDGKVRELENEMRRFQ